MVVRSHPPDPIAARAAADVEALAQRFAGSILAVGTGRGEPSLAVRRDGVVDLLRFLREEMGYQLLRSVTAVDFLDADPRFQVVYHLTALPERVIRGDAVPSTDDPVRLLRVKVPVTAHDPVVPTVTCVYETANWHEREVYDMFGIDFAGHPDLRRILMPDGFDGHPLRKDFPLQYEDVAFTHNRDAVHRSKPRPAT